MTISIDSGLLETVKQVAMQRGCTLGQFVTEALEHRLTEASSFEAPRAVSLPTSGQGGLCPGVNLSSNAEISALLDGETI